MKNFICFVFIFAAASINNLQSLPAQPASSSYRITASEYANFLNAKAINDTQNLYSEKMMSDPGSACIIRRGSPGNYFYEVIAGREIFPITYVTKHAAEEYFTWLQQQQAADGLATALGMQCDNDDIFIASQCGGVSILIQSNRLSLDFKENDITHLSTKEEVIGATAGTILLAIFAWKMCRPGEIENQASYSKDRLHVPLEETVPYIILPREGSFSAGATLLQELSNTTKKRMLVSLNKHPNENFYSMKADLERTEFTIHLKGQEKEPLYIAGENPDDSSKEKNDAIELFKSFIGQDHLALIKAVASIMHQGVFSDAQSMIKQIPPEEDTRIYSSDGLIKELGKISTRIGGKKETAHDLEKEIFPETSKMPAFVLSSTRKQLNNIGSEIPYSLNQFFSFTYHFILKPDFKPNEPITEENFPCAVECKDFQLRYQISENLTEEN